MPRNSSRKKAARRQAARRGERYTRALRAATSTRPETTVGADDWIRDLDQIQAVQQVLEARGWVIAAGAHEEFDDDGSAATMDACWVYPTAFTGSPAAGAHDDLDEDLAEDGPRDPECSVAWDAELGLVARIQTAGNWGGCRGHRTDRHSVPIAEATHPWLPRLLATVERAARATDPTSLLDCTRTGPCGHRAQERAAHRDRIVSWTGALVETARRFSPDEMAELSAWENEHLGRTLGPDGEALGTGDWPGWTPLIGPPPWQDSAVTEDPELEPVPVPSPDNDSAPVDLLRPVLDRRDISLGASGVWMMLVSYYWSCEDDRTVTQLREHRPQDAAETEESLAELTAAGMITVSAGGVVTINPDHLGVITPLQT